MISYNDLIEVEYDHTRGRPAKLFGRPEDCYPEEPDEFEITAVYVGEYQIYPKMDKSFLDHLVQMCEVDMQDRLEQQDEDRAEAHYHDSLAYSY